MSLSCGLGFFDLDEACANECEFELIVTHDDVLSVVGFQKEDELVCQFFASEVDAPAIPDLIAVVHSIDHGERGADVLGGEEHIHFDVIKIGFHDVSFRLTENRIRAEG